MKALLLLLAVALPASAGFDEDARRAEAAARQRGSAVLRVLTFNVFGVKPWQEDEEHQEALGRFSDIGRELRKMRESGLHLVAIQEAFHFLTDPVVEEAGFPYVQRGAGAKKGKLLNSGLIILSVYPLSEAATEDHRTCAGWDCFANKGYVSVKVAVPGVPGGVLFLDTHLNADTPGTPIEKSKAARMDNTAQMMAFMDRVRAGGEALIFGADFNFKPDAADYALFAGYPGIRNAGQQCGLMKDCGGDGDPAGIWAASIDHQFYLGSEKRGVKVRPVHFKQTFKDKLNGRTPSDHLGVEAHYLLTW